MNATDGCIWFSQRMIGQRGSDCGPGKLAANPVCLKEPLFGTEMSDATVGNGDHRVALPPKDSEVG
jgi:hypothetical protein